MDSCNRKKVNSKLNAQVFEPAITKLRNKTTYNAIDCAIAHHCLRIRFIVTEIASYIHSCVCFDERRDIATITEPFRLHSATIVLYCPRREMLYGPSNIC